MVTTTSPQTRNGRTWYWWVLGICAMLIGAIAIGTFGLTVSTATAQTSHNIDKEAHPTIAGQLNMIENDVATNKRILDTTATSIGEMHDEQIRQGVVLEQIKASLDGGRR